MNVHLICQKVTYQFNFECQYILLCKILLRKIYKLLRVIYAHNVFQKWDKYV